MKSPSFILTVFGSCFLSGAVEGALTSVYSFNETSGNTAADSVRGAPGDGTLNNFTGAQWVPGKIGNAIEFDGANDFVLAANVVPTGTTALTISAWIWADAAPVWGTIVKNWGGASAGAFHFGFQAGTGQISNFLNAPTSGPLLAPGILTLNQWHHVAVTYSGASATQTLYIDGLQVAQLTNAPPDLDALTPNMSIGVKTANSTLVPDTANPGYWDGKIDDLAFWNEALTAVQILAIKTNGDLGIGVPEPASAALLLLGISGIARRRR